MKYSRLQRGSSPGGGKSLYSASISHYGSTSFSDKDFPNETDGGTIKVGICGLFRCAVKFDILLLTIGLFFSVLHGAGIPVLAFVFGQMTNTFIWQETNGFQNLVARPTVSRNTNITTPNGGSASVLTQLHVSSAVSNGSMVLDDGEVGALSPEEFLSYMSMYSLYYLYIGIVVLFSSFIQTACWELSAERQVQRLHQIFFSQVLRQDITWYETNGYGDLTSKLSDDLERIREGIGCKFSMVTQALSTFVTGIAVGLYVNWRLTSAILFIGPILIGLGGYMAKVASGSSAREQMKYAIAGGIAEEVLYAIRTVVAFGGEKKEALRYGKALEEGRQLAMGKYYILAFGVSCVFLVTNSSYGLTFWYGTELVCDGRATPGSVFTIFFSVMSGAFSLGGCVPYLNAITTAIGSASTIFGIISRVPRIDPYSQRGIKPHNVHGHITFNNVHFSYPSRPNVKVLKALTLDIPPGKTVALVGPSGCGKSTIVSLLMRFYDPASGQISLDGVSLPELNVRWLRGQIGLVSQEPILFGVSIEENIRYGCEEEITHADVVNAAILANAHTFITNLPSGYETAVGTKGAQLSGGQKQRIAIARAIVSNPKILVLDEATSALDSHSEGIVQEALDHAMQGRTTIIVAHRLSTIRDADIIYALQDSVVVESGTHEELMAKQGLYHGLVTTQVQATGPQEDDALSNVELSKEVGLVKRKSQLALNKEEAEKEAESRDTNETSAPKPRSWVVVRLLRLNSPEWYWILLGVAGCCLNGASMPIFAFFFGQVFSTFTLDLENLRGSAVFWSLMFVVLGVSSFVGFWLQIFCMTSAGEKLLARVRLKAFENILRQSVGWFDLPDSSAGKLITRLARDAPLVKDACGLRIGYLLSASVTLLSAVAIALVYGWKLASILAVGMPLIVLASYKQQMTVRKNVLRDVTLMDNAGKVASECVSNVRTVQSLSKESQFVKTYIDFLVLPFREAKRQAFVYASVFAFAQAMLFFMYAAAFRFGAYLIHMGEMKPADVYRVFFALAFSATGIGTASAYLRDYVRAKEGAESMFRLMEQRSDINASSPSGAKPTLKGKVTFENVHFHYPSRPDVKVLNGLSCYVEPGKTLALVGESGCGKSTVVALLERFYDPYFGSVRFDGIDIRTIHLSYLRQNIGLVTQEPVLFNCSIKENIAYGIEYEYETKKQSDNGGTIYDDTLLMERIMRAAKVANIHQFIVSLPQGYDTPVGEGGSQLSGGQKQRIAIARAVIRNPKILLLDEATSALDTESEKVVEEALERARAGRTCIVVAHRLSTIQNADAIAVMRNGTIVEHGTHDWLKNNPNSHYYKLIERQNL